MADNILRLKVESSEYDAKLKKAAEGIRHLAEVAHQGGGELTGLEKAELDYIRALGDMETKSRSASGQARELANTYKELKVVYDQLNEVEKADEGGKALAASLETLKQRAQEAKAQLDTATNSLNDNGQSAQKSSGFLEGLASKFTINFDALTLFNKGLQVAEVALNVAKDAFFASEATVDEWGRIVDSSKSLYEGFLTALNTGDVSGYLGRIDEIVQAARTAYNELDRLGTMKTIQAPKMSAQQTENERMRMMIQTGRYIAPIDGRKAYMQNGQLLTPDQIKRLEQQLQGGMQKVVTLVGNEVAQTGKAIDAVYNRQAKELGMDLSEFRKGTSSMAEFDKRMEGYDKYQKWRNENYYTDNWGNRRVKEGNPYEEYKKWGTFRVDGERYNDLVRLIQQRDQQAGQAYGMQSQSYRAMNRAEGVTVSKLMRGETASNTTTHTASPQQRAEEQVKDALSKYNDTIGLATKQMEAGNITEAEFKSQMLSQQQRLYDAYGQAYRTYADPKYKEAQQQAADEIVRLGGEVKTATEAQKKTQESARQLEQAQKELAKYEKEAADAMSRNDLTGYFAAMEKVKTSKNKVTQLTSPTDSHEEELAKARKVQSTPIAPKELTITANFEEALAKIRKIESAKITPKEFVVTAETEDAMAKLREVLGKQVPDKEFIISATDKSLPLMQAIDGVSIQPKTFVVTAETEEAMGKLREVVNAEIGNKEFIISANDEEALAKARKIDSVKITPKEFTITADDEEALAKVQKFLGIKLAPKEFTISANDEEALAKARKIDSVKITPKTFVVTAETDEALSQLREVMGEQIPDKEFIISATDESLPLMQAIDGVNIQPKTFVVTAETEEAMGKLREVVNAEIGNKEFIISANDEEALAKARKIDSVKITPKEFVITADDEEALAKVHKFLGIKLASKEITISANDEEALAKARKIDSVKITPKTFVVTAETAEAMSQLREVMGEQVPDKTFIISATDESLPLMKTIDGVSIQPKTFVVTAETAEAMSQLREVVGEQVPDKTFIISATDKSLPLMQAIAGVSIEPKTFSVTADTAEAMSQLREVVGEQVPDKTFIISATDESLPLMQAIDGVSIQPKTYVVTAETDDAMSQLREVMGEQIPDKTFIISATDEALPLMQAIKDVSIEPKEFIVTANTEQAQESIKKLDVLSAQTEESLAKPRKPQGKQNATTPSFSLTQNNLQGFIANVQKQMGDTSLTTDLFGDLTSQLNDAKMLSSAIQTAIKNGLDPAALGLDNIWKQVFNINPGDYIDDSQWEDLRKKLEESIGKPIEINFKTGEMKTLTNDAKTTEKSFREAASAVSSVSSALSQLEDPGAKIAGIIGQAIANIALGFAQATAASSGGGIFGWIAAIVGGMATMISTISAIHNATGYAEGGIVKGSTYSGDRVQGLVDGVTPVGLNAGEVVLNHSQQATLAAELADRDNGGGTSSRPYVDAETIYLGVSNYLKRSGRGEILTTKNK